MTMKLEIDLPDDLADYVRRQNHTPEEWDTLAANDKGYKESYRIYALVRAALARQPEEDR